MKETFFDKFILFLFRRIKNTKMMAVNMREPKHFILGYIARKVMFFGNQRVIEDSVEKLCLEKDNVILEVGSGNGEAILEIQKKFPKTIYAIEISEKCRNILKSKFDDENLIILENDAKDLKNIIQSNSIDRLLLINVIYFLDPIERYLQEFKRIIKDDGIILISGKFDATKDFDETVFKNIQLGSLLESLDDYFQVSCEYVDLGEERSQYHAITLKKSK